MAELSPLNFVAAQPCRGKRPVSRPVTRFRTMCSVSVETARWRPFAEMSLAGLTHQDVAAAIPCAVRTVERKMALILQRWQDLADADAETRAQS